WLPRTGGDDAHAADGGQRPLCRHAADDGLLRAVDVHERLPQPRFRKPVFRGRHDLSGLAGQESNLHADAQRRPPGRTGVLRGSMRAAGSLVALSLFSAAAQEMVPVAKFGVTVVLPTGLRGLIYRIPRDSNRLPDGAKLKKPIGTIYTASLNVPEHD